MKRSFFMAGALALALSGCAQVGMFTVQDAATAAAINPANAACYQAFGALGQAQGTATGPGGVLTIVATKEQISQIMASPQCLPLTAAVLAELVKLGIPGGALIVP